MLRNFIKIAWRNLRKNKTFSIINLVGLSLSVSFCLLLFFHIRNEQSFDAFHKKKDRLFRLEMTSLWDNDPAPSQHGIFSFLTKQDDDQYQLIFPVVVAGDMQHTFPEIKSITRIKYEADQLVKANQEVFKEGHILYADANFFDNLSFPLIEGNARTVLSSNNNVILSETVAKKYFGNKPAMGKNIVLVSDSDQIFTVAGIAKDAPANSSIQYGIILPTSSDPLYARNLKERFNHSDQLMLVELNPAVDAIQFQKKMTTWVRTYFLEPNIAEYGKYYKKTDFSNFHWHLRPLADCHYNVSDPWGHYSNAKNIYLLACLVFVILSIASLNYVLLALSSANSRSQEVGVRKVMGAKRKSIIIQFWVETQMLVVLAVTAGLILSSLILPLFNAAMATQLHFEDFSWLEITPTVVILSLMLGGIAGYYPAWLISKMRPVSILKSFQTYKINPRFSRIMVVVQYTGCVVLMIATFVINRQMRYIQNKDLGFDKQQILIIKNPKWEPGFTKNLRERLYAFARTQPSILKYSAMLGGLDGKNNESGFTLDGVQASRNELSVDYNYFDLLGLTFIQGRPFSLSFSSDTSSQINPSVVNESLFKILGKDAKLGVYNQALHSTIIGVVKDYNFESLTKEIEPEEHLLEARYLNNFLFKIKAGQIEQSVSKIEKEWKQITHNYPFEYSFLDQNIAKMYEEDARWQRIIQASCFFAILISCLGLFGLSAINAMNRKKEIGIRKVLGADIKDILGSLSFHFLILVGIAILIAIPLAWWIMNKWLEYFVYRIHLSIWSFLPVALTAIMIALITISIQSVRAALVNPVKNLRTE